MSFNITITEIIDNVEVSSDQGTPITLEYNATVVQGGQGYTGSAGAAAAQGYTGSEGVGYTGSEGAAGTQGIQGIQGAAGYTGSEGSQGVVGFTGSKGDVGFTGSKGDVGYGGSQGNKAGLIFKFSNSTNIADPGAGYFRINTGTNKIAISRINADGSDMGDLSSNFIPSGSGIYIVSNNNSQSTYFKVDVTLSLVRVTSGQIAWYEITYTNPTLQGTFTNDEITAVQVVEKGYTGSKGDVGFTGSQGIQGVVGFTGSKGDIGYTGSYGPVDLVRATNDTASTTLYPVMVAAAGSDETAKVTTSKIEFNAATGVFKVTGEIVAEKLTIQYTTVTTTDIVTDDVFTILNATNATSTQTGALVVTGGAGFGQDLFIGGQTNVGGSILPTANGQFDLGSLTQRFRTLYVTSSTIDIGGATLSVNPEGYIDVDKIELTDATEASSTETGALIVTGGVGIGKNLHVGGEIIRNGISIGYAYTGSQGNLGIQGDQGFTGSRGDTGFVGSQGIQGEIGFTGSQGDQGIQGEQGFTGSQGDQGNPGDIGFSGSQGIQGEQGIQGFTGSQGIQGEIGFTGSKGDTGFVGSQGIQGIQGEIGFTGSQGIQGEIGFTGSQGIQGEQGFTGSQGIQGEQGFTGSQGDLGYTGSQGIQGEIGFTGSDGIQGEIGFTGSQGIQGFDGSQGEIGFTGSRGSLNSNQDLFTTSTVEFSSIKLTAAPQSGYGATSINIGNDCYIGDSNVVNGFQVRGFDNDTFASSQGWIQFGNDFPLRRLGRYGGGYLPNAALTDAENPLIYEGQLQAKVLAVGTGTTIFTLPATDGDVGQALVTNGAGVVSWSNNTGYAGSQGIQGFTGSQGIQGELGYTGSQGDQGVIGFTGSFGITGYTGSQGIQGFTGSIGFTGSQGIQGTGYQIFSGSTPTISTGTVSVAWSYASFGDIFIAAAGTRIRIVDGDNSAKYMEGTIVSTSRVGGAIETIVVDVNVTSGSGTISNTRLYSAIGYAGSQGIQGFTGSQGIQGFTGSQGVQGIQGFDGSQGVQGIQGIQGEQGIQGYTGSLGELGYTGSKGDIGFTGSQGIQGIQGFTGSQGIQGDIGFTGSQGIQGDIGFTGSQGVQGYTGSKGDTGLGFNIAKTYSSVAALTADTSPTGIVAGEFAIIETGDVEDPENSRLYLWNGTAYSYTTDLSGAVGIQGEQGIQGFTGSQGIQGNIGFTGSVGLTGDTGATGYTGSQGIQGDLGYTGSQGIQGDLGYTGSQGIQGDTGFVGSQGDIGYTGSQGPGTDQDAELNTDGNPTFASVTVATSFLVNNNDITAGAPADIIAATYVNSSESFVTTTTPSTTVTVAALSATGAYKIFISVKDQYDEGLWRRHAEEMLVIVDEDEDVYQTTYAQVWSDTSLGEFTVEWVTENIAPSLKYTSASDITDVTVTVHIVAQY